MSSNKSHIIIIGSGIIGLQTAQTLLEKRNLNLKGGVSVSVSVVAEYLPGDELKVGDGEKGVGRWATPWAGAHWRTHAPSSQPHLCDWDTQTYNHWLSFSPEERESMGLGIYKSTHYWDAPCAEIEDGARSLWWSTVVQNFEVIDEDSLPEGVYYGVSFTAFALDPVQYLRYLYEKVQALGARVVRAKVPVEDGLAGVVKAAREAVAKDVVGVAEGDDVLGYVNATGIAAGKICGDEAMGVQRGQTVLIKGEAREIRTRVGAWKDRIATVIPRRGAGMSVVGVSKETGVWDTKVDDEMTKNLLEAGKKLAPELLKENGEFEVVSVQVGLRPSREGGPRVELEVLPAGEVVVHEYGHGGAGYQNSIGSANQVLRLLQAHFKQNEDTKV